MVRLPTGCPERGLEASSGGSRRWRRIRHNPQCTGTFSGTWNDQDVVWLHVGGSAIGKTVFGSQDNSNTIARHFANFTNAIFDGV